MKRVKFWLTFSPIYIMIRVEKANIHSRKYVRYDGFKNVYLDKILSDDMVDGREFYLRMNN